MKNQPSKTYLNKVKAFTDGFKNWKTDVRTKAVELGNLLVEMLDENENTFEVLCKQGIALNWLESFERVGRGKLDPVLLFDTSYAAQRAISQVLPMDEQKRLLTSPVAVVVRDNGGVRVEHKRISELTMIEAARVIGDGKIRTSDEQVSLLKSQDAERAARSLRYEIRDGRIKVYADAEFTWSEWMEIGDKAKPKAADVQSSIAKNQIVK